MMFRIRRISSSSVGFSLPSNGGAGLRGLRVGSSQRVPAEKAGRFPYVVDRDEQVRPVPTGRVKWYDVEKGFGFLSQDEGEDVYVRSSALPAGVDGLKPGQRVEFGMAAGRRGPQALSLKVLESPPSVRQDQHRDRGAHKEPAARK